MRVQAFLLGITCCLFSFSLFAADNDLAGQVIVVSGPFRIIHADNTAISPKRGDNIFSGDTLVTGNKGSGQIRFTDGGVLALAENSQLKINDYHYEKNTSEDKSVTTLIKGGLRALTGLIAKEQPSSYKIQTAVAVIGVRGTNLGAALSKGKLYTGVWKGGISVQNTRGSIDLGEGQKYQYSVISRDSAPVGLTNMPAELKCNCSLPSKE